MDDHYPPGTPIGRGCPVEVQCPECGLCFEIPGFHELGVHQTLAGTAECPQCGEIFDV